MVRSRAHSSADSAVVSERPARCGGHSARSELRTAVGDDPKLAAVADSIQALILAMSLDLDEA